MPTKLDYLQPKKLNPADELRELLARLESASLRARDLNPDRALAWLRSLDEAYTLLGRLEAGGSDLLPEKGRLQAQEARLGRRAGALLKALGGPAALAEVRPRPAPDRERWWWYIHELVAGQQQALLRRIVIAAVIILLVIGGVVLAFNTVLAPSPEVVARLDAENGAWAAIDQGNYQAALAAVEQGLARVPADPGLLLFQGVLQQLLGQETRASQSFAAAQSGLPDQATFYLGRSQLWLRLNRPADAEHDARAALDLNQDLARAWLVLGQALEGQARPFEAQQAYEKAGNLALAHNDNEVYVLARLALGRLSGTQMGQ